MKTTLYFVGKPSKKDPEKIEALTGLLSEYKARKKYSQYSPTPTYDNPFPKNEEYRLYKVEVECEEHY